MRIIALLIVLACFATAQTANADLVISINIADQALMFLDCLLYTSDAADE